MSSPLHTVHPGNVAQSEKPLFDVLMAWAEAYPLRIAIRYHAWSHKLGKRETTFTFAELAANAVQAANLFNGMFIGEGIRVATYLPGRPEFIFAGLGAAMTGTWTPLRQAWSAARVAQFLKESQTRVLVTLGQGRGYTHWEEVDAFRQSLPDLAYILSVDPDRHGPFVKDTPLWKWIVRKPIQVAPSQPVWDFHKGLIRYQTRKLDHLRLPHPASKAISLVQPNDEGLVPVFEASQQTVLADAFNLASRMAADEPPVCWIAPEAVGAYESLAVLLACWYLGGEMICYSTWADFEKNTQPGASPYWLVAAGDALTAMGGRQLPRLPGARVFFTGPAPGPATLQAVREQAAWEVSSAILR